MVAESIKLFEFNQKYCQAIGIELQRSNRNRYSSNLKNAIFVFFVAQFAAAALAFMFYDAKTIGQYGVPFFALLWSIEALVAYFITIWKLKEFAEFTKYCEEFIEKSKLAETENPLQSFMHIFTLLQQEIAERLHIVN